MCDMARGKSKAVATESDPGRKGVGRKEAESQRSALRQMLVTSGSSFTRQRGAVFDYLSRVDHHPTAEEVFIAVKQELPKISLATVYKNLEALVACGAASKLTYGDSAARYEIRTDHHYHSRCLKCGRITDVAPTAGEQLLKLLKAPSGFKVEDYRIELLGHCEHCR
jgi:Fur family transcriptional regulator, peroxide stress response regulator